MRYLRMLSNSVVAGLLSAAYLAVLVLQLNPEVPLTPAGAGAVYLTLALTYGVHLAVVFYAFIVLKQIAAVEVLSPGWLSVRLLSWLAAAAAGGAAVLMQINLETFRLALEAAHAERMALGAVMTGIGAVGLLALALWHSFGRPLGPAGRALFGLLVLASLAGPLAARGMGGGMPELPAQRGGPPPVRPLAGPRVHLLAVDGASLDHISPAAADGRLPYLGRLLDAGASMHLTTVRPTQAATVWTAVATGRHPARSGVRSAVTYRVPGGVASLSLLPDRAFSQALVRLGVLEEMPVGAQALRTMPFWQIFSERGIPVGVVNWPLTFPALAVRGYLVSDRFYQGVTRPWAIDDAPAAYPAEALSLARRAAIAALRPASADAVHAGADAWEGAPLEDPPLPVDLVHASVSAELDRYFQTRVHAWRYEGLDAAGHLYLRYAQPRAFGDVTDEELRRHGQVLDRHYRILDDQIGAALERLAGDDLLLVVSGYGMEPVGPWQRLLARALGDADLSGTHDHGPDGFLLAFGSRVAPGRLPVGSVVDVLPTVLYYLGLPVGRDLDGYARTDLFVRSFTEQRPITFIPTYER